MEAANSLLNAGALVDAADKDGNTALILAATEGRKEVVRLLLARNANLRARDKNGWTAAMWAASLRNREISGLLERQLG